MLGHMAMQLQRTFSFTDSPAGAAVGRARRLGPLEALTALAVLVGACASSPPLPPIDQPGVVADANAAIRCDRGTVFAAGQTQGRLSAVWCERPDGRRHGPYLEWWENHQKKGAGSYRDGVRHGTWTFFLPSGERDSQSEYVNGEAVQPAGTSR